jgi:hypothetical protein
VGERGGVGAFIAKVKRKNDKQFKVSNHKLLQNSALYKNYISRKNRKFKPFIISKDNRKPQNTILRDS